MGVDGDGAPVAMARMGRSGRERGAAKADAILGGARREFLAHGYAATSMDRVAAAAGVSKRTVYDHFGDKERLFETLVARLAQEKYRAVVRAGATDLLAGEPRPALRHLFDALLDAIAGDPDLVAFIRLLVGESGRSPALARAFVAGIDRPLIDALGAALAAHSTLRLADPTAVARVAFGALFYDIITTVVFGGGDDDDREGEPATSRDARDRLVATLVDLIAPPAVHG